MQWLVRQIGLLWLALACCLPAQAGQHLDGIVQAAAQQTGVPVSVIRAVIQQESAHNPGAVSHKGAQGLMQLMPGTAARFGVYNVFDPAENIRGGTTYLAWLYNRYQSWPLALAGYNAGEGAVDKYAGIPPYRETQDYVRKIMARLGETAGDVGLPGTTGEVVASPFHASLYSESATGSSKLQQVNSSGHWQKVHTTPVTPQDLETAAHTAPLFFGDGE
ncbi:MAG TPA: lytic transglycosylase domain-containing protein [Candidatus Thiothrix moscowensis]|uniref:lytic transglycosylase domain-containing protein n=1 Tax=Thiothrix sp. UBA2016 TaxID=1947695 RepID=UPI0025D925AD|nr:lytic transglycosylase domain-containing protein [Thiothrix sp. UBA2016]HRJ53034.1 lytic transglycosylase domain-containing protein [Candidatus Thiothrix moscowensis]HRJ93025.1 lytic transglycosylase domain-containing protein [Candidatus Thiothrix moscowensis]